MAAPIPGSTVGAGDSSGGAGVSDGSKRVLYLVFAVFFILGGVTNINDILIPKLKGLYQLSHFQANLVQFAFFTSYAIFSIPAGVLLRKLGYIRGFVVGFLVVAAGALLFLPAANTGVYASFLAALFVIGGGITLLQVAMNPVVVTLGDPSTASSRLTFAQAFNSVGVFLMVYGGAELLLGDTAPVDTAAMAPAELTAYRVSEATVIGHAYIGLAIAMVAIAALFWFWRKALDGRQVEETDYSGTLALLASTPRLQFGALCIFAYVGAEVAIASNMVAYMAEDRVLGLSPVEGGRMVALYWGGAMVGRLVGGFVLRAIKPGNVLAGAAAMNIALLAVSALTSGGLAAWSLVACGLFNSIMFPTIFSLSTQGLNERAAQASGVLCTAIVGGALIPPALGLVADGAGLAIALVVPIICYLVIAAFGRYARSHGIDG
ncbi:L-fucose-proton symporter [Tsuneonella dongtanensis]|uniref:L-fucose-proton symporter n=1 Tax=Tsuneonella dongtanensis TaxID=692370 RepID=A0A1B2A8X8_9SPHN|nr:sugar MFS transporter [Tsuneonella dongtanensis]ANY18619.1 L-fucose-proton symporter [Tsuneonella dongtanensis]